MSRFVGKSQPKQALSKFDVAFIFRGHVAVDDSDRHRDPAAVGAAASLLLAVLVVVVVVVVAVGVVPSPCLAHPPAVSTIVACGAAGPSAGPVERLRIALISIVDGLSRSGARGMATYALGLALWTMTAGMTTPIETAAGMAFPLRTAIPLSAIGKVGGATLQYVIAKYLFSDAARRRMDGNEWMESATASAAARGSLPHVPVR